MAETGMLTCAIAKAYSITVGVPVVTEFFWDEPSVCDVLGEDRYRM